MSTAPIVVEQPAQGLFCVNTDDDVASLAGEAAAQVSGCMFFGEFRDYITADRRPQFSPMLKQAKSCVALVDFDKNPELALKTAERLQQIFSQRISIVGVSYSPSASLLLKAMRIGCVDFLSKPIGMLALSAALVRFQETAQFTGQV